MNRTNSRNSFRSKLEKQDFGVCTWMFGEIISFLESLKGKMEDSAFLRRAKYEFTVTTFGEGVNLEISGFDIDETYKDRNYFKKYYYFTANEHVLPNSTTVEKWGYARPRFKSDPADYFRRDKRG